MRLLKTNYDDQFQSILSNAERNLDTINNIKIKFDQPINDVIEQLNTQEFKHAAELKKRQKEIQEQKDIIDNLNHKLENLKDSPREDRELSKNEKRILKELKVVNKENRQMKEIIQEFKEEVDY